MEATLQDLLHAVNILGDERDISVEGHELVSVTPPIRLTPAGRRHFKLALEANVVVVYQDGYHMDTFVNDDDDFVDMNDRAYNLLKSLAGDFNPNLHEKWFEGETAEMI